MLQYFCEPDSICLDCANSCGKCSWSKNLTPVKGWVAEKVQLKILRNKVVESFYVMECPLFCDDTKGRVNIKKPDFLAEYTKDLEVK